MMRQVGIAIVLVAAWCAATSGPSQGIWCATAVSAVVRPRLTQPWHTGEEPATARWKAGAAKIAITPEHAMWMSGYAARTRPAEGKLHDLWAKALILEDPSGRRAVLVTMDLV